jgi:hypothetical protein
MKNKLSDLNNHLFAQLERLNDDDLKGDQLKEEINRAKAMSQVATQIVNGAKTVVDAMRLVNKDDLNEGKVQQLIGDYKE